MSRVEKIILIFIILILPIKAEAERDDGKCVYEITSSKSNSQGNDKTNDIVDTIIVLGIITVIILIFKKKKIK